MGRRGRRLAAPGRLDAPKRRRPPPHPPPEHQQRLDGAGTGILSNATSSDVLALGCALHHDTICVARCSALLPQQRCPDLRQRSQRSEEKSHISQMKHIFKIVAVLVAISAIWIALLETSIVPRSYTWLLPIYLVVALGCYGLFMVGFGLMFFPTCPHEAILLQQDIVEAKEFLARKGVDVGSE